MTKEQKMRCKSISWYMITQRCTVRQAAKIYGISKSTVYQDVTERISKIDKNVAAQVRKVLEQNKAERSIRGGMATKRKYSKARQQTQKSQSRL